MTARGNKGEWGEFYAFIKLLTDKKMYGADENLNKIDSIFYPILKIIREESDAEKSYELLEGGTVKILSKGEEVAVIDSSDLKTKVRAIFDEIKASTEASFEIPIANDVMVKLHTDKLNAGNSRKDDLTLDIHDQRIGSNQSVGFSIKSMIGSAATLLNAGATTNFVYKINNLDNGHVDEINAIDTRSKIKDRLLKILSLGGTFSFEGMESETFMRNLRKIDSALPEIVAESLLIYNTDKGKTLSEVVDALADSEAKITDYAFDRSDYEFKMGSLLHNVALGMVPGSLWSGSMQAHGGYIIVKEDGELVCYHVYNLDDFKKYLLNHTRFETASSSRHGFGTVYSEGGSLFVKLNLQIRFI